MVYWVLHKKLSRSDWSNTLEGEPGYFYERFKNFAFIDITDFSFMAKLENALNPIDYEKYDISAIDTTKYIFVKNKSDFRKLHIASRNTDIFVFQSYQDIRVIEFSAFLHAMGFTTAIFNHWQMPTVQDLRLKRNGKWFFNILKIKKKILFLRFLTKIHRKLCRPKAYFTYALAGGNNFIKETQKNCLLETIVPVHSISYDEFLVIKNSHVPSLIGEPYFVFIDQALTIHPDTRFKADDTELYKKEILKTFDYIQKKYKTQIVIAEHPRIKYPDGFWGNYRCFQGHTPTLLKYCQGILGHYSSVINLAYLLNISTKIFLTSSSPYFYLDDTIRKVFAFFSGSLIDMATGTEITHTDDNVSLKDDFSLCPDEAKRNRAIFYDFLSRYNHD